MEAVRNFIEWVSTDTVNAAATLAPYGLLALAALYVLWLVIGYLRVSQVAIQEQSVPRPAVALPRTEAGQLAPPRGLPYCPVDGLQYPAGARYCTQCEADLVVACANCGTTIRAADESCYRCGTRATMVVPELH
ncbi:MAG TPA: zinc ribbon domain-containing protein [Candidatus Limnocylindria bacterium]|nr:zinc ribbon domain-containing protein [Candidatus Limnocylindria bacterium]